MNYNKIRYALIDSLNFNECCLRKTKLIRKLAIKANNQPMNLAQKIEHKKIICN